MNHFKRFQRSSQEQEGEINISPLIDVVFILLIFFIVTTVFVEETGIEINKPRAASQQDLERESILIGITSSGQVFYAGREIGINGVQAVVRRVLQESERPVIIQADSETATETTVAVLDEAKLGGAAAVFISTLDE